MFIPGYDPTLWSFCQRTCGRCLPGTDSEDIEGVKSSDAMPLDPIEDDSEMSPAAALQVSSPAAAPMATAMAPAEAVGALAPEEAMVEATAPTGGYGTLVGGRRLAWGA